MIDIPATSFQLTNYFGKISCEPSWKWLKREKPLENFDLFYVWSGVGEVIVNELSYSVRKGSCFLFRPGDYTSATHDPQQPLTITYIHFQVDRQPELVPERYRVIGETVDFETLLTRYIRLSLTKVFGAQEESQLILKELMIHLLRADRNETDEYDEAKGTYQLRDTIFEIANYIHEHPSVWPTLEDLAKRTQLSPRYFSMKFKEIMKQSVREYIIECRIKRAEHLLHYAGMNVSEVAEALGYQDVYFFSRQYKKYTGKNPSKLR